MKSPLIQQVQRYHWDCLLEAYNNSIPDLLDALLEEVGPDAAAQRAGMSLHGRLSRTALR